MRNADPGRSKCTGDCHVGRSRATAVLQQRVTQHVRLGQKDWASRVHATWLGRVAAANQPERSGQFARYRNMRSRDGALEVGFQDCEVR